MYSKQSLGLITPFGSILVLALFLHLSVITSAPNIDCAVPSATYPTIQSAVDDAGCATVVIDSGIFYENVVVTRSVRFQGQGSASTTIDGFAAGSVFSIDGTFDPAMTVTLNDIKITNGSANSGGGIHNLEAALRLDNCLVTGNWAFGLGGGLYSESGELTVVDSVLSDNEADTGGGVYVYAGSATFANSAISDNEAGFHAGGLYNREGSVTIRFASVADNTTYVDGGGLFNYGTMTIEDSAITGNESTDYSGGGIRNEGLLYVNNSTISGNSSVIDGAGIDTWYGTLRLNNSTVAFNVNGGVTEEMSNVRLKNTIVANNVYGDCRDNINSDGYNLDSDGSCNFTATGDISGTNPLLGPLQDDGGPSTPLGVIPTHNLLNGSPAIEQIPDGENGCVTGVSTDQRGYVRAGGSDPGLGGVACEMGAYEYDSFYAPPAGLSATNNGPTLLGETTTLSATLTSGTYVTFIWLFGDGTMADGQVVTHTYAAPGDYYAYVEANGPAGIVTTNTLVIVQEPVVGLEADSNSPTLLGETTAFSATVAAGSNVIYDWNFGDDSIGQGQFVSHIYPVTGTYTATVTARNAVSTVTETTSVVVEEAIVGLTAVSNSPTMIGETTTFTATVTAGSRVTFNWDFGDATTGTGASVTHAFATIDEYYVTVTATNPVSSQTYQLSVSITPIRSYLPVVMWR